MYHNKHHDPNEPSWGFYAFILQSTNDRLQKNKIGDLYIENQSPNGL